MKCNLALTVKQVFSRKAKTFISDPFHKGSEGCLDLDRVFLSAGAGFVVAVCGEIMLMPGLPKNPAAEVIDIDADGNISGLF